VVAEVKETIQPVKADTPDPRLGQLFSSKLAAPRENLQPPFHVGCDPSMLKTPASATCCQAIRNRNEGFLRRPAIWTMKKIIFTPPGNLAARWDDPPLKSWGRTPK
jgi:hypothetical protein